MEGGVNFGKKKRDNSGKGESVSETGKNSRRDVVCQAMKKPGPIRPQKFGGEAGGGREKWVRGGKITKGLKFSR